MPVFAAPPHVPEDQMNHKYGGVYHILLQSQEGLWATSLFTARLVPARLSCGYRSLASRHDDQQDALESDRETARRSPDLLLGGLF